MGEADKHGLSGPGKCGQETKREARAEGSGFRYAGLLLGLGGGHGLAGIRRATSVNSVFVSILAICEISFS
jgi:hypothetical protein